MAIFGIFESSALSYQIFFSGALMFMQSKCVESSDIKLHGLEKNVPFYKTSKHFTVIGDISALEKQDWKYFENKINSIVQFGILSQIKLYKNR